VVKYIFVDVDGVVNPVVLREGGEKLLALPHGTDTQGYYLRLHKDYGRWLKQLSEDTESFLVWGSTWQIHANRWVGEYLELPHLSHLDLSQGRFSESLGSIKADAANKYADGNRFVFFDDEPDLGSRLADNGLHIRIDYRSGLEEYHIEEARNYLLS